MLLYCNGPASLVRNRDGTGLTPTHPFLVLQIPSKFAKAAFLRMMAVPRSKAQAAASWNGSGKGEERKGQETPSRRQVAPAALKKGARGEGEESVLDHEMSEVEELKRQIRELREDKEKEIRELREDKEKEIQEKEKELLAKDKKIEGLRRRLPRGAEDGDGVEWKE